jgi:diguanylate cyclase (GGDEF)-like protein
MIGTLTLFLDTLLIILVYEFLARLIRSLVVVRVALAMLLVLAFDTAFFVTGSFVESPAYASILLSGLIGKSVTGVIYAVLLTVYLLRFDVPGQRVLGTRRALGDLFEVLTYRQRYELLRAQMTRDGRTGVYNRAFFDESLETLLARSHRSGSPVVLMMIDVDHFKQINDRYGHRIGDEVLRTIAQTIAATCRASDLVCRYGGEEFTVLLPDTELESGVHLAERIGAEVPAAMVRLARRRIVGPVTVTIGVAAYPGEASTLEDLILLADRRLYEGKSQGRNRVVPTRAEAPELLETRMAAKRHPPRRDPSQNGP